MTQVELFQGPTSILTHTNNDTILLLSSLDREDLDLQADNTGRCSSQHNRDGIAEDGECQGALEVLPSQFI